LERDEVAVIDEVASDSGELNLSSVRSLREGFADKVVFKLALFLGSLFCLVVASVTGGFIIRDSDVRVSRLAVWEVDDVGEEWDKGQREGKARKEEIAVGKFAPGGSVGRVRSAWDVLGAYITDVRFFREEGVDTFENVVGFLVSMTAIPPAFDDPCVISIDEKISTLRDNGVKGTDE
jgi:hypothetical protein